MSRTRTWKTSISYIISLSILITVFLYLLFNHGIQNGEEKHREKRMEDCRKRDILLGPAMQDDPCIVDIIRASYLIPPSTKPYNLTYYDPKQKVGVLYAQVKEILEKYLDTKNKNGFFIECGANDGEYNSFTLPVEFDYKWSGLLVEATPAAFEKLKQKNRKAWLVNACLSPVNYTAQTKFFFNPLGTNVNGLYSHPEYGATKETTVQCFPLYAILAAINITTVDYFSLDVEGAELEILKTMPFDKVTIKVISLEHRFHPDGRKGAEAFLKTKGYKFIRELIEPGSGTVDSIYVHKSVMHSKKK